MPPTAPDRRVIEAAEAICGGLSRLEFQHLGETDAGRTDWFTRGDTNPTSVRVSVERAILYPAVFVTVEFFNQALKKHGKIVMQLDCKTVRKARAKQASEDLVRRVLEIYRDVITKKGVAGPDATKEAAAWHTAN